jgi:pyridoxal phosphate-dependent aminotransferase EpsN
MDPNLLRDALKERTRIGKKPGAVIVVHLYGQSANIIEIKSICKEFDTLLIEDAAESIGAFFDTKMTGTIGNYGIYSFNGNKIITTSGGGMLVGQEKEKIEKARFLSTQARDPNPFYQHTSIGYNYRMSNVLAAIGRGQLTVLENRVDKRRENYDYYKKSLSELDCVTIIPRDVYGRGNCWLTCIVLDSKKSNITPEDLRISLEKENIESRPLWKPMHLQPIFSGYEAFVSGCSEQLFNSGLCLPSGTAISAADLERVVSIIKKLLLKQIR